MLKYDAVFKRNWYESARNCDVSSSMYCLKFTFKGPEYTRNKYFLWFSCRFSEILKNGVIVFSQTK